MPYCMYLRKSRADMEAEARGEGETLARHEKILIELAKKMKLDIMQIHKEIVSGETISSRPVMQQLLNEVESGLWKGVLVVEVERLARGDTIDQGIVAQAFKYTGTKIITPMKIYDPLNEFDEEYFEFGLFMSRREYKTINRRLQRGRVQSVKEGKYLGSVPPYGYVRKKLEKQNGYTLAPHPEQASVVKLIFDMYTRPDRIGVSLIARKLNEMKVPTANGGDWVPSTVQGILRNPVYIGKIRWNARCQIKKVIDGQMVRKRPRAKEKDWILTDGLHKALLDEHTFYLAQKYISENGTLPLPTKHSLKSPLAGLILCGKCGRKMVRRPYRNGQPDTLMCPAASCDNISSPLHLVEERLVQALAVWLDHYRLPMNPFQEDNKSKNIETELIERSIERIDKEIDTLIKQSEGLHDLLEQRIYTIEKFLERSKIIHEKIRAAEGDKNKLEEKINSNSDSELVQKIILPKIVKIIELYDRLREPKDKNNLLKAILEKAIYTKTVNGRWHHPPDDFELVIYPKLPKYFTDNQ